MTQSATIESATLPYARRHRTPLVMFVTGFVASVLICADVYFHGRLSQADLPVARFIYNHTRGWDIFLCAAISGMGELAVTLSVAVCFGGFLLYRRHWRELLGWALGLAGCGVINPALKSFFGVPRPEKTTLFNFFLHSGYSFPSGHAMSVAISTGLMAMIAARLNPMTRGRRMLIIFLAGAAGILEAFALLYVGVHYLTDVLGALAISLAWLGVMRALLPPIATIKGSKIFIKGVKIA